MAYYMSIGDSLVLFRSQHY